MVVFGLSREMWLSLLALALAGAFDLVSVVLRSTILPLVTPDEVRGRVNAVEMVFISASNELGAFESGVAAALIGAAPAVIVGGIATIAVAGVWWKLFPALAKVDRLDDLRPVAAEPGSARRDHARLVGEDDRLHAVAEVELRQDARDVGLDRVLG